MSDVPNNFNQAKSGPELEKGSSNVETRSDKRDQSRYSRQVRFPAIGKHGQELISKSRALVVGCGALGSVIANTLVRAGVGHMLSLIHI